MKCPNCNSLISFEETIPHDKLTDDRPYVADIKALCKCGWSASFCELVKAVQEYRANETELLRFISDTL